MPLDDLAIHMFGEDAHANYRNNSVSDVPIQTLETCDSPQSNEGGAGRSNEDLELSSLVDFDNYFDYVPHVSVEDATPVKASRTVDKNATDSFADNIPADLVAQVEAAISSLNNDSLSRLRKALAKPKCPLTEEEVTEALHVRLIKEVDTLAKTDGIRLLAMQRLRSESTGNRMHRNLDKKVKAAIAKMDSLVKRQMNELEEERLRINRARAPPLQFNWADAADSAEPTEDIHVSEAPPVPKHVKEVITHRYAKYLMRAMQNEMESLTEKEVWTAVPRPSDRRVIRSKWVFDYKKDPEGYIRRFKARLVAVGCSQVENQDYTDTHSPVVKLKAIRILLALSALCGMEVGQIDVDTAYLYGNLTEPNYMEMPRGFEQSDANGKPLVAKLQKALYGLHQSGREWYFTLRKYLKDEGFKEFKCEPCVFSKVDPETGKLVLVFVYVDDILIASPDKGAIQRTKDRIRDKFKIKDLGEAQWVLKVQVKKIDGGLFLSQESYTIETLKMFNMWDIPESRYKDSPMATNWAHDESSELLGQKETSDYATLVAKLIYLSQLTRPDILYTVNTLAQFQRPARKCDWDAGQRLLKYLRATHDWGLYYKPSGKDEVLVFQSDVKGSKAQDEPWIDIPRGFKPMLATDASYGQEFDRKSRSAYAFMVFGCLVSWYSKKQPTTALSSTEAELNALVEGLKEAEWMRMFLREMGFVIDEPMVSQQDNKSVIAIAENPIHHARIKHMEIKTHFVREKIEDKLVKLVYCPTEMMIADVFTKALPASQHYKLCRMMGMYGRMELESKSAKVVYLTAR